MYKVNEIIGADAVAQQAVVPKPVGPGFAAGQVKGATRMEIWGTSFHDPGPDYTEFRLFKGDRFLASSRIDGY